jgi:hypothetical protein
MTKKDYIAIANALKDAKNSLMYATVNAGETKRSLDIVSEYIAKVFKIDNVNFDRVRFFEYLEGNKRYKDFTDK